MSGKVHNLKHFRITLLLNSSLFLSALLACCNGARKENPAAERSFYYWKSVFSLTAYEEGMLDSLKVSAIYLKLFDADWNPVLQAPQPSAQLKAAESSKHFFQNKRFSIIPVVFITNECIRNIDSSRISSFAQNIILLIEQISVANNFTDIPEWQMDCDWTVSTREKYFRLLEIIRSHTQQKKIKLSATIRLHQLKYSGKTGVPPVDKGLLMCYNMGNLKNPAVKNSILEAEEMKKYISSLKHYSLALDVALPLFDWFVWFRNNSYHGLIHTASLPGSFQRRAKTKFEKDSTVNNISFLKDDWLRYENSTYSELEKALGLISRNSSSRNFSRIALYHLDSLTLSKYQFHELENIFNMLH